MDTKERRLRNRKTDPKTPARRPRRTRSGIRHTALAAKNDLERRKDLARGARKIFLGAPGVVKEAAREGLDRKTGLNNFCAGRCFFPHRKFEKDRERPSGVTTMLDQDFARIRAHRNNLSRYRRLLKTELSDIERQFIERRLAEEQTALEALAADAFPAAFTVPNTPSAIAATGAER
ncbi:hypothetical protein [Bradyrhizobium symbiodeficiens]|uniref:hypothetical protein n=1 Tax=Bradyrhizobium symbiodeficiens TaxID=1404367 RepID=UPI0039C85E70